LGLIEAFIPDNDLIMREWRDDEMVVFSNVPLPKILRPEELYESYSGFAERKGVKQEKLSQKCLRSNGVGQ